MWHCVVIAFAVPPTRTNSKGVTCNRKCSHPCSFHLSATPYTKRVKQKHRKGSQKSTCHGRRARHNRRGHRCSCLEFQSAAVAVLPGAGNRQHLPTGHKATRLGLGRATAYSTCVLHAIPVRQRVLEGKERFPAVLCHLYNVKRLFPVPSTAALAW